MNPIVITGVVATAVLATAMMVSYSDLQLEQSRVSQEAANVQAERAMEDLSVRLDGGQLVIENVGPVPVDIEVRVLDGQGHVSRQQKADLRVLAALQETLPLEPATLAAFGGDP